MLILLPKSTSSLCRTIFGVSITYQLVKQISILTRLENTVPESGPHHFNNFLTIYCQYYHPSVVYDVTCVTDSVAFTDVSKDAGFYDGSNSSPHQVPRLNWLLFLGVIAYHNLLLPTILWRSFSYYILVVVTVELQTCDCTRITLWSESKYQSPKGAFIFMKRLDFPSSLCWAMIRADRKCESGASRKPNLKGSSSAR